MAKYIITETSFIDGQIVQDGQEIVVADEIKPGPHWTPVDEAAKKAAKDVKPGKVDPIDDLTK